MNIGERMKSYEQVFSHKFTKRSPLIVRVDGRHFHTFTRGAEKPFDQKIIMSMVEAAKYVAKNMQGFKAAFIQSDEASFLITDYDDIKTQGWFDYELNKIVSISAARMSVKFNDVYRGVELAEFDSRAFVLPKEDVANYFLWRALDWKRNSVQMLGQAYFSQKELHKKKLSDIHELLYSKEVNWARLPEQHKNGTWISKDLSTNSTVLPNYESIYEFVEEQF